MRFEIRLQRMRALLAALCCAVCVGAITFGVTPVFADELVLVAEGSTGTNDDALRGGNRNGTRPSTPGRGSRQDGGESADDNPTARQRDGGNGGRGCPFRNQPLELIV